MAPDRSRLTAERSSDGPPLRVAVVGGGIGGLTAAVALRRRGIDAQVYEAAPALAEVGAGILVPPNAMQVLDRLGLARAVLEAGLPLTAAEIHDARDGLLQRIEMQGFERRFGVPTLAIHRARLHRVLAAALPDEVVHLGRRCVRVRADAAGAEAAFADGSAVRADVVVGADGLRSAARQFVLPDVPLRYSGQTAYRAVVGYRRSGEQPGVGRELWGAGCRFGYAPIAPDEVYWFATIDAPAGERDAPGTLRPRLDARFAAFPDPVPALVGASDEARILRTDLFDFAPISAWHRGRVVLLGDAAHATTPNLGQGGAQAIEDAWVLADRLAAAGDVEAAFAAYEAIRAPKARLVVTRSRQFGRVVHVANPLGRAARNVLIRLTPASVTRKQAERLYALNY